MIHPHLKKNPLFASGLSKIERYCVNLWLMLLSPFPVVLFSTARGLSEAQRLERAKKKRKKARQTYFSRNEASYIIQLITIRPLRKDQHSPSDHMLRCTAFSTSIVGPDPRFAATKISTYSQALVWHACSVTHGTKPPL